MCLTFGVQFSLPGTQTFFVVASLPPYRRSRSLSGNLSGPRFLNAHALSLITL
ncbi:MAG: hypothetical protein J6T35_01160 [Bacteroidales bacterium]|nr:hypothetical protein [Bacteroidales bacterium]